MGTSEFDQRLLTVAVTQAGAIACWQVASTGAERAQLERRVRSGVIERLRKGVFVHRGFPPSREQRLWLAHLSAGPLSAIGARSAGRVHGLRLYRDYDGVDVLTLAGGNPGFVLGQVHETFWLPPEHKTTVNGLAVTTLARTVFDLAGLPEHPLAFRRESLREIHVKRTTWMVNAAIRDQDMRMADLVQVLASTGRRGKDGTAIIREVVADLGKDYVPSASEFEDTFLALVRAAGLPEPDREVNAGTNKRWVGRVDFRWRGRRVIAEVDGSQHNAPLERRADRARDGEFGEAGWIVCRFTWWEVVFTPEVVIAELRKALAV